MKFGRQLQNLAAQRSPLVPALPRIAEFGRFRMLLAYLGRVVYPDTARFEASGVADSSRNSSTFPRFPHKNRSPGKAAREAHLHVVLTTLLGVLHLAKPACSALSPRKLQRHRPELPKNGGAPALDAERGARAEAYPVPKITPQRQATPGNCFDLLD
jgi:hypothetical protein